MSSDRPENSSWSNEDKHTATARLLCVGCWMIGLALGGDLMIIALLVDFVLMVGYAILTARNAPPSEPPTMHQEPPQIKAES